MDSVHAVNRKAFRLCIHCDDCGLLLDPTKWPQNKTVSEWFFKSSQTAATATVRAPDVGNLVQQNVEQRSDQPSHTAKSNSAARLIEVDDPAVDDIAHHSATNDAAEDTDATILTSVEPSDQVVTVSNDGST